MSPRHMLPASFALLIATLLGWVPFARALDEDAVVKAEDSPILVELKKRISELVTKSHPETKVTLADDELVCEYRKQKFMIHKVGKGGSVSENAHEEIGPTHGGFVIRIGLRDHPYQGASGKPYGVHRRHYWHDYINEYQIPRTERVVRLDLTYGNLTYDFRHNAKLFREIRTLCEAHGEPLFAVTEKRPEYKNILASDVESAGEEWEYFRDVPDKK